MTTGEQMIYAAAFVEALATGKEYVRRVKIGEPDYAKVVTERRQASLRWAHKCGAEAVLEARQGFVGLCREYNRDITDLSAEMLGLSAGGD